MGHVTEISREKDNILVIRNSFKLLDGGAE